MGRPVREALRRLCVDFGWSYAVFWRAAGLESRMHLIWEDGYCNRKAEFSRLKTSNFLPKEQVAEATVNDCSERICRAEDGICVLVDKVMASQVHVVGDGLIGQAASMGKYRWFNNDGLDIFGSTSKGFAELMCQIEAGIKTTVIVPMLPAGVIQLGSTKMIMENFTFINHVKSLFLKLNDGSGALPSDTIQKYLRDRRQTYSSYGLSFACQSTDACTTSEKRLPVTGNESIPELIESPAPRGFAESFSAVSRKLNERIQPSASEAMPSKHTVTMPYRLDKYILQGTEDSFPKPELECSQQVPSDDSSSKCHNELSCLNPVVLSNSFKVLQEQLVLTSSIGAQNSVNNLSSNSAAELGNAALTSRSCGVIECPISSAKLSVIGEAPILYQKSHPLLQNPCIMEVSKKDRSSADNISQSLSKDGAVKQKDYLIQASCTFSSKPDVRVSCSDILPGIFQGYGLCNPKTVQTDNRCKEVDYAASDACPAEYKQCMEDLKEHKVVHVLNNGASPIPLEFCSSNDLFGMLSFDHKTYWSNGSLDDVLRHNNNTNSCNLSTDMPSLPAEPVTCRISDSLDDQIYCSRLFSVEGSDQLLDAVISNFQSSAKHGPDGVSSKSVSTDIHSSHNAGTSNQAEVHLSKHMNDEFVGFSSAPAKTEPSCLSYSRSSCSFEKDGEHIHKAGLHKSQISSWVESCQSAKNDCVSDSPRKKSSDLGKLNRKRPRPGESPRPRPKDRQMIQDRIKELREIVPNGTKCSIDTLLEKTIKHMLFLQSVTKHADELKVGGEPKIRNEEGGLLLKDNFEGGATWAFEVGTQPMMCPIVVEDLNPPRQMLVEMLCEERGSFLEIADFIRGLGLTILKGVMEARRSKIWARFAVEANRDVTRMEIFLSLVQLLEPTAGSSMALPNVGNISMLNTMFQQSSVPARVI